MNKNIDFGRVADLYDVYVQWYVDLPFFREMAAGVEGEVLELMCGTGRLSIPLLRDGVRLCCVDYSAEMIAVLRSKLRREDLAAEVHEMDVRALSLDRTFNLVLLPFHSLSEIIAPEDRVCALTRVREHMAPNGRCVVTLHNPFVQVHRLDQVRRLLCENSMPGGSATLRVWSTAGYHPDRELGEALQEYEILGPDGELLERRELPLRFAVIDRPTFEAEAAAAGLAVRQIWGDYSRGPFEEESSPYMIWELDHK
jgi:SAM-dependent methyltransferase